MILSAWQTIGLLISVLGIAGIAIYAGTRPQTFANVNGPTIVTGILIGTLVGGSSTVGTAQLAFTYGMSAWWFTLGGGIACLILALLYVKPLRRSGCMTLAAIIGKEYGETADIVASILNSIGTFINVISQLLAGTAVIAVVFPELGIVWELIITAVFMAVYVIFGGNQGAGRVGILKAVLLYISMIGCAVMVLYLTGGLGGFMSQVHSIDTDVNLMSLFARGIGKDSGACMSLILGVLTTQTYAMALMSAKSDRAARTGALAGAVLIPPIGIGGILVGLYMRANYPAIAAKTALTTFVLEQLPGFPGGIVLGTLFIAVVGTGAGLAMGLSTVIRRDIIFHFRPALADNFKKNMRLNHIIILFVLFLGCCLSTGKLGDTILNFAFMSMGLRGAVVFAPLVFALWFPGRVNQKWAMAAIIAGPAFVLLCGTVLPLPGGIDALFAGVAASLLCCLIGMAVGQHTPTPPQSSTRHHFNLFHHFHHYH